MLMAVGMSDERDVMCVTFSTGVGVERCQPASRLVRARRWLGDRPPGPGSGRRRRCSRRGGGACVWDRAESRRGKGRSVGRRRRGGGPVPSGDAVATTVLDGFATAISATVVKLAFPSSLDVTIVGRLKHNIDLLGWQIGASLERYGPRHLAPQTVVGQASLGDDSGLVGAAGWNAATGVWR